MRLQHTEEELAKTTAGARHALTLADEANGRDDTEKAREYQHTAELFANRMVVLENEVGSLRTFLVEAQKNADDARVAVAQNAATLRQQLTERQRLLSLLDQAKLQEQMSRALGTLAASVGAGPSGGFEQARHQIEARAAHAQGLAAVDGASLERRALEVEQAQIESEARTRLAQLRAQLGLPTAHSPLPLEEGPPR
jgi:phage shock protein A